MKKSSESICDRRHCGHLQNNTNCSCSHCSGDFELSELKELKKTFAEAANENCRKDERIALLRYQLAMIRSQMADDLKNVFNEHGTEECELPGEPNPEECYRCCLTKRIDEINSFLRIGEPNEP